MSSVMIDAPTGTGARARLKAYSSFEPYELADYLAALAARMPDVAIAIERMPTATLTERLLAERDAPGADMVFGWADTASHTQGLGRVALGGSASGNAYIRPSGFSTAFVVDPWVLAETGAQIGNWRDLADPRLEGRVVFPDPAISGAGFLALTTILQYYGEDDGWDLLSAICANVSEFPASAWKPAELCGNGIVACGVTVKIAATRRIAEWPALRLVEPADVVGAEAEVYGALSSTRHPEIVGDVIEWILSKDARILFDAHNKTDLRKPSQGLFMIDAAGAVADRERWLALFKSLAAS